LTVADPLKGVSVSDGPRRALPSAERDVIETALSFGKPFNSSFGGLEEIAGISKSPPAVVIRPSPTIPFISRGGKSGFTAGLGFSGFAAFAAGVSLQGGIYGSSTGEFGFFGTAGFMAGFVGGAGVGPEFTVIFGAPSDFKGVFVAIAASVSVNPIWSVGGTLIFSPGPVLPGGLVSLIYMGFSLRATAGPSSLPVSVAIEWTNTAIKPIIRL
jgi:hypothetical protein